MEVAGDCGKELQARILFIYINRKEILAKVVI